MKEKGPIRRDYISDAESLSEKQSDQQYLLPSETESESQSACIHSVTKHWEICYEDNSYYKIACRKIGKNRNEDICDFDGHSIDVMDQLQTSTKNIEELKDKGFLTDFLEYIALGKIEIHGQDIVDDTTGKTLFSFELQMVMPNQRKYNVRGDTEVSMIKVARENCCIKALGLMRTLVTEGRELSEEDFAKTYGTESESESESQSACIHSVTKHWEICYEDNSYYKISTGVGKNVCKKAPAFESTMLIDDSIFDNMTMTILIDHENYNDKGLIEAFKRVNQTFIESRNLNILKVASSASTDVKSADVVIQTRERINDAADFAILSIYVILKSKQNHHTVIITRDHFAAVAANQANNKNISAHSSLLDFCASLRDNSITHINELSTPLPANPKLRGLNAVVNGDTSDFLESVQDKDLRTSLEIFMDQKLLFDTPVTNAVCKNLCPPKIDKKRKRDKNDNDNDYDYDGEAHETNHHKLIKTEKEDRILSEEDFAKTYGNETLYPRSQYNLFFNFSGLQLVPNLNQNLVDIQVTRVDPSWTVQKLKGIIAINLNKKLKKLGLPKEIELQTKSGKKLGLLKEIEIQTKIKSILDK